MIQKSKQCKKGFYEQPLCFPLPTFTEFTPFLIEIYFLMKLKAEVHILKYFPFKFNPQNSILCSSESSSFD